MGFAFHLISPAKIPRAHPIEGNYPEATHNKSLNTDRILVDINLYKDTRAETDLFNCIQPPGPAHLTGARY